MLTREGKIPTLNTVGVESEQGLRDLERIDLSNSQFDLDLEIGILRDMSETLVLRR